MIDRLKVLIVEDDAAVRLVLRAALSSWHLTPVEVADGGAALAAVERERPTLIVLDVQLPGKSGFEVIQDLRAAGHMQPVLFLTSHDEVKDRVRGLSLGADDYLTKPFDLRELGARIRALLRRMAKDRRVLRLGATLVDLDGKKAEREGRPLALTKREFCFLEELAKAGGQPVSREALLQSVWGYKDTVRTRTLETMLWRLRKKLNVADGSYEPIRNVPGVGYALVEAPAAAVAVAK